MKPIFISGIGTGIGKTLVSAVIAEALQADYWKPVQAGRDPDTDSLRVKDLVSNTVSRFYPESYIFSLPASPHLSARKENKNIVLDRIVRDYQEMDHKRPLVVEGAGGLMVPLNEKEFVIDLIGALDARLVLVSRNYLGSINHSLMTAQICRARGLDVAGWVFNDHYMDYANEIAAWSGLPKLFELPRLESISKEQIAKAGVQWREVCISTLLSPLSHHRE
jgi:dethiobiotin synthetase